MNLNTPDQAALVKNFREQGYVFLPGFLGGERLEVLQTNLDRFIRHRLPSLPPEHVFHEVKGRPETLKQIQRLFAHDAWFKELMFEGAFQELSDLLLGPGSIGKNLQYFNKPPGIGQPTPPHQDGYYFMLEPCEAITMWLALDEVDEENGCVRYIPRSHQHGMRPHQRTNTLGFSQGIADYNDHDRERELFFRCTPGDLLVHHALTIHRADGNPSANRHRRALGFIYYSSAAKTDEARHAAYQERLTAEMTEAGKI